MTVFAIGLAVVAFVLLGYAMFRLFNGGPPRR